MSKEREDGALGASTAAGVSAEFQRGLDAAVARASKALRESMERRNSLGVDQAQGLFAEQWHAHTFNINAYKKGARSLVAEVLESTERASPDVVIRDGSEESLSVQLKYHKSGANTAKRFWNPEYDGQVKVVPSDQLAEVRSVSVNKTLTDARLHVKHSARHTAEAASDRLHARGVESRRLSRSESARGTERTRAGEDVLSSMRGLSGQEIGVKAAKGGALAAGVGFALAFAPRMLLLIEAWRKGQGLGDPDFDALLREGFHGGAREALRSGLQGAVSTALIHATAAGHLGQELADLGPGPLGAMSVVILKAISDGAALYRGDIDTATFAWRTVTTAAVSSCSCAGAAFGQALIPIPVLGAMVGSSLGGLVAKVGISGAEWTAAALRPHLREAINRVGETLFAWDLVAEARAQSTGFKEALVEADAVFMELEHLEFRTFAVLSMPAIQLNEIGERADEQRRSLHRLEEAWHAYQGERDTSELTRR